MDVLLVITPSDVCHDGDLQISIIISYDRADILIVAKFPLAKFVHIKHFFVCSISELHIIYASLYVGLIQSFNKLIGKIKIINQSTISNCCIQDLDVRTKR